MQIYQSILSAVANTVKTLPLRGDCLSLRSSSGVLTVVTDAGESDIFQPGEVTKFERKFKSVQVSSTVASDSVEIAYGLGFKLSPWSFPGGSVQSPSYTQGIVADGSFVPYGNAPVIVGGVTASHTAENFKIIDGFNGGIFSGQNNLAAMPSKLTTATPLLPVGGYTSGLPLYSMNWLVLDVQNLAVGDIWNFQGTVGAQSEPLTWIDRFGATVTTDGNVTTNGIFRASIADYSALSLNGSRIVTPGNIVATILIRA